LNAKQNTLIRNHNATGIPVIDEYDNSVRHVFGVAPLQTALYFDPDIPGDLSNNQIQISFDNTLSNLTNYYTSSVSDAKYAPIHNPTFTGTANFNGPVNGLTAAMVGLGKVDNTSDMNKPISSSTQAALNILTAEIAAKQAQGDRGPTGPQGNQASQ
jgi:hypothetical protein